MKVYIVSQGYQNDTEFPIAVYLDDKKAKKRVDKEEKENDKDYIYFNMEAFDMIE